MRKLGSFIIVILLVLPFVLVGACRQPPTASAPPIQTILPTTTLSNTSVVQIKVHADQPGNKIPSDFVGLSYDDPLLTGDYFDDGNQQYINLLTNLGKGVICFGANGLEYTYWPRNLFSRFQNARATLAPGDLDRMFSFAKKAGWRVIFGLNLGANDPEMAADIAAYATKVGSDSILAFEVGNEPDLYFRNGIRPTNYNYAAYKPEFETYLNAIRGRVPNAPIAGPVTASNFTWFSNFLKDEGHNIVLATNHAYPLNADPAVPSEDPRYASIPNLLSPATTKTLSDLAGQYANAAQQNNLSVRFDETNSSYPPLDGLGDSFASALWGVDYLFNLAERGVVGANFFGGFICHGYTPICRDEGFLGFNKQYHPQALYYGMLLFHIAAQGRIVPVEVNTSLNVTAHSVLSDDGKLNVVIINKDSSQTVTSQITVNNPYTQAGAFRLIASSLEEQENITLAGSSVNKDGTWFPHLAEQVPKNGSSFQIIVPAASAVLIKFS